MWRASQLTSADGQLRRKKREDHERCGVKETEPGLIDVSYPSLLADVCVSMHTWAFFVARPGSRASHLIRGLSQGRACHDLR